MARDISLVSSDTPVIVCDNLNSVVDRNRCLFGVFSRLEGNGKLEEGIEVCKHIEKIYTLTEKGQEIKEIFEGEKIADKYSK